jgi:hypothetical protein
VPHGQETEVSYFKPADLALSRLTEAKAPTRLPVNHSCLLVWRTGSFEIAKDFSAMRQGDIHPSIAAANLVRVPECHRARRY